MMKRSIEPRRWLLGLSIPVLAVVLSALAFSSPQAHTAVGADNTTATPTPTATATAATTQAPTATPVAAGTATPAPAVATPAQAADAASPAPAADGSTTQDGDNSSDVSDSETRSGHDRSGGGGDNFVQVVNRKDDRLRVRGSIQINHIEGDNVSPLNEALAYSQCDGCQTIAVALQIDLVSRDATSVTPQNYAYAINYQCTGCTTVARALQYVIPVDDPDQVPDEVRELQRRMDAELRQASRDPHETLDEAEARVDTVVGQFQDLANSLYEQRDAQSQ